jgi:hypothetical protein
MCHFGDHVVSVVVAVGAGKDQNSEFHGSRVSAWRNQKGILPSAKKKQDFDCAAH